MPTVQSKFLNQENISDTKNNVCLLSNYIHHQQKSIKTHIKHSKQKIKDLYHQCSVIDEDLTQAISLRQIELETEAFTNKFNERYNKWLGIDAITSIIQNYHSLQSDIEGSLKTYEYSIKLDGLIQNIIGNVIVLQSLTANATSIVSLHSDKNVCINTDDNSASSPENTNGITKFLECNNQNFSNTNFSHYSSIAFNTNDDDTPFGEAETNYEDNIELSGTISNS